MRASAPEYHVFRPSSHSRMRLQHRASKIGGFISVAQMQHLNASDRRVSRPNGILDCFESASIALVFLLIAAISLHGSSTCAGGKVVFRNRVKFSGFTFLNLNPGMVSSCTKFACWNTYVHECYNTIAAHRVSRGL